MLASVTPSQSLSDLYCPDVAKHIQKAKSLLSQSGQTTRKQVEEPPLLRVDSSLANPKTSSVPNLKRPGSALANGKKSMKSYLKPTKKNKLFGILGLDEI